MKKVFLFLFVVTTFSSSIFCQSDDKLAEVIGFSCFSEGSPTKTVQMFTDLIKQENFEQLKSLLNSNNNAEKYLAVICLEQLELSKLITLTPNQKKEIAEVYFSKSEIGYCSGCMYMADLKFTLSDALKIDNNIRITSNLWLNNLLKN